MLKNKPHITYSVPCIHGLSPPRGESQRVLTAGYVGCIEKAKTVCQYVKFSLYNSLRITNYLISPLEEVARASM